MFATFLFIVFARYYKKKNEVRDSCKFRSKIQEKFLSAALFRAQSVLFRDFQVKNSAVSMLIFSETAMKTADFS